mmetsp:Transcript_24954/g.65950  ORF Transcript_24954/g.65950 Transcript_24954/m.65950 type:complete len:244 (-) Transcript_24954:1043-1774(-)
MRPAERRRRPAGLCPHRPTRPLTPAASARGSTPRQSPGHGAGSSGVAWSCEGGSPSSVAATTRRSNGTGASRKRRSRGVRSRRSHGSRSARSRRAARCGTRAALPTPRSGACRPHGLPGSPGGRTCTARRRGSSRSARCRLRCPSPTGAPCSAPPGRAAPQGSLRRPSPANANPGSRDRMAALCSRRPAPHGGPEGPAGRAPCTTRARGRRTPGRGPRRRRPPAGRSPSSSRRVCEPRSGLLP